MSIILTHSYFLFEDEKEQNIMRPYAPLGLLYISSYLNENNVENHVYDSTFYSKEKQLKFIADKQPKAIAIYTNLMTKVNVIELVKILSKDATYGFPKIILGGPDITYNLENYLNTGVDFLIIGEGEQTALELYNTIINNGDCSKIHGIAYLEDGEIKKAPPRMRMKSLKELPLPNRAAIPVDKYLETWKTHHGKSSMTISTQRGCPYTCKWCSTAVYGQSYRRRPPNMVAAELKLLKDTYNPDSIWFVDDVFSVSHKWIEQFHEEVLKQDAIIPFECITRAERLNDNILKLLKEAGCFRIWIGAESGSQKIIDAMDRRVDVDVVKSAIQKTNALGMETGTFIMVGYPGENEKDINDTITYLKAANPTLFTITVAYPIKGTSLYNDIEDRITTQPNWETSTDRDIDFTRTYSRKFYDYAVKKVVNEVNYHKEKQSGKNLKNIVKYKVKATIASALMRFSNMKQVFFSLCLLVSIVLTSCSKKETYDINLKWNKAYPEDTFERNITGLKWALSYLGSTVANDSTLIKFNPQDSIVKLNIKALGFSENSGKILAQLQYQFKQTDYYKANNSYDLGRYVALTFGNPKHYYAIVDISETFKRFKQDYNFSDTKGYINNSSVSNVHRIISFSNISENNSQAFISAEIDSITKDTLEYETMEVMPNGQLKFGIYDVEGKLKNAASPEITRAGTPSKCIWCHEVVVQPLFKTQRNYKGYLDYLKLDDTLNYFNKKLQKYQDTLWLDKSIKNKKLHTELELLYISFMEPSAKRISREWHMPLKEVKEKLSGLETHVYKEFPFLGNQYHRKDIDALAPYKVLKVSKSIRE